MFPIFDIISPVINKLLDFIPDPQKKAEALAKAQEEADKHQETIVTAFLASDQAQAAVNAEEAKSSNLFISGARPFIMWVCACSLMWQFIVEPIIVFIWAANGKALVLPTFDFSTMSTILFGLLGLGGLRTYERINGKERNNF